MTAEQKIKQRENIQKVNKLNVTSRPQQYVNPNWLKRRCKHVYEQLCTIHPDRQNAHLQTQFVIVILCYSAYISPQIVFLRFVSTNIVG